jgi:hypothetical protein
LSDLPFALFVWLFLLKGDAEREWTWPRIALLGGLALLAVGTRAAGLALFPSLLVAAYFRSPVERNRLLKAGAMGGVVGVAVLLIRHESIPFMSMIADAPLSGVSQLFRSLKDYRLALFESTTYPTTIDVVNDIFHVIAPLIMLLGVPTFVRRYRRTLLFSFTLCYSLMLVVVPVRDGRYTWPLWPVVLCLLVMGLARAMALLRWPVLISRPRMVASLMLILASAASIAAALRPRPETLIDRPTTLELFAWLRSQPGHERFRVVYESPRIMALYARIPAMPPFRGSTAVVQRELNEQRITHAIFGGGVASAKVRAFPDTVRALRPAWQEVFSNADYQVYARPQLSTFRTP